MLKDNLKMRELYRMIKDDEAPESADFASNDDERAILELWRRLNEVSNTIPNDKYSGSQVVAGSANVLLCNVSAIEDVYYTHWSKSLSWTISGNTLTASESMGSPITLPSGKTMYVKLTGCNVADEDGIYEYVSATSSGLMPTNYTVMIGDSITSTSCTKVEIGYYVSMIKTEESTGLSYGDTFLISGSTSADGTYTYQEESEADGYFYTRTVETLTSETQTEPGSLYTPAVAQTLTINHNLNSKYIRLSATISNNIIIEPTDTWASDANTITINPVTYGVDIGTTIYYHIQKLGDTE